MIRKFLRRNKRSVAILAVIVVGVAFATAQMHQREKNDARAALEGDILVIPTVTIK
jgi:hypothetical protein